MLDNRLPESTVTFGGQKLALQQHSAIARGKIQEYAVAGILHDLSVKFEVMLRSRNQVRRPNGLLLLIEDVPERRKFWLGHAHGGQAGRVAFGHEAELIDFRK